MFEVTHSQEYNAAAMRDGRVVLSAGKAPARREYASISEYKMS
jgi:hypothetical protein